MHIIDWKILANADLTAFELYNLATDVRETTDLKNAEPQRFAEMRAPPQTQRRSRRAGPRLAATLAGKRRQAIWGAARKAGSVRLP